ncbi:MAG: hypothetical protein QOD25_3810 [Alphaproteobacteria bacterium]|nr:hypothetical protein [Alphaproteobacteria bacterium]
MFPSSRRNLVSNVQRVGWPIADGATLPLGVIAARRVSACQGSIAAYCMAVSRVAQAWATLRSGEAFPGNVAQPPFSM